MDLITKKEYLKYAELLKNYFICLSEKYEITCEILSSHEIDQERYATINKNIKKFLNDLIGKSKLIITYNNIDCYDNIYFNGYIADILEKINLFQIHEFELKDKSVEEKINIFYESISKIRFVQKEIKNLIHNLENNYIEESKYIYDDRISLIINAIKNNLISGNDNKEIHLKEYMRFFGFPIAICASYLVLFMIVFIILKINSVRKEISLISQYEFETFELYKEYTQSIARQGALSLLIGIFAFLLGVGIFLLTALITGIFKRRYFKTINKLAEEGNISAKYVSAWEFRNILFQNQHNNEKFISKIIEAAEDYYPPACYELAKEYEKKFGVLKRDYNQALKYYKYSGDYKDAKNRYNKILKKVEKN